MQIQFNLIDIIARVNAVIIITVESAGKPSVGHLSIRTEKASRYHIKQSILFYNYSLAVAVDSELSKP